jgi:hypothetical protein
MGDDRMEIDGQSGVKTFRFRNYQPLDRSLLNAVIQKKGEDITYFFPKRNQTPTESGEAHPMEETDDIGGDEEEKQQEAMVEASEQQVELMENSQKSRQHLTAGSASVEMKKLLAKYNVTPSTNIIAEELAKYENQENNGEISLVPKKINWDLKEQFAPKLAKLKKRTQKAIVEILREKFANENVNSAES